VTAADLKNALARLAARHDGLSRRERSLLCLTVLALLYCLWDFSYQRDAAAASARTTEALATAQARLQSLAAEAAALQASSPSDPNAALRARLAQLTQEHKQLHQQQNRLSQSFIDPDAMPPLLERLLRQTAGLRLVSLATLAPQAIPVPGGDEGQPPLAYRHGLLLELEGGYFELLHYLQSLESQPIFWQSIEYHVKAYPVAKIRLEVFTLSFHSELLRV
jgi:MSHA biogenesis protein MshJ